MCKSKKIRNFAFFESYFSNYIEGTEFSIEDAHTIISTGRPLPMRNDDLHDVLGTYAIVSNKVEMQRVPGSAEELIRMLQARHAVLLEATNAYMDPDEARIILDK